MSKSDSAKRLADNLEYVRRRIADAALRSGRSTDQVTLVAVTKYVDAPTAELLIAAGCRDLGESRPQELARKAASIDAAVRWHLIGHLQRNKVKTTIPSAYCIHSVDSRRLLEAIDKQAAAIGADRTNVLLEVNISGDAAKHGLTAEELAQLLDDAGRFEHVGIRGLMAMAGFDSDSQQARREFAALRELRDERATAELPLADLSMGMSRDYEVAIEEGATMVRVGSALFEGLET